MRERTDAAMDIMDRRCAVRRGGGVALRSLRPRARATIVRLIIDFRKPVVFMLNARGPAALSTHIADPWSQPPTHTQLSIQ